MLLRYALVFCDELLFVTVEYVDLKGDIVLFNTYWSIY